MGSIRMLLISLLLFCLTEPLCAQTKSENLPARIVPVGKSTITTVEDSLNVTLESLNSVFKNLDETHYDFALANVNSALATCPTSREDLRVRIKSYLTTIYIKIGNSARARKLLASLSPDSLKQRSTLLDALYEYNIVLYLKSDVNSKVNVQKNLDRALDLFQSLDEKAYTAKIYALQSEIAPTLGQKLALTQKAQKINSLIGQHGERVNVLQQNARYYLESGLFDLAYQALDSAKVRLMKEDLSLSEYAVDNYELRARVDAACGKFRSAYENKRIRDSLYQQRMFHIEATVNDVDMFNSDKLLRQKQQIIEYQRNEFNTRMLHVLFIVLICILAIISILSTYSLRNIRSKKRVQELENARTLIEIDSLHAKNELTNLATYLTSRNEIIHNISQMLGRILKAKPEEVKGEIQKLNTYVKSIGNNDRQFEHLEDSIASINHEFVERLCKRHPDLTKNDKNIACLLRAGMSTKQIAQMLNISDSSVNMARYRMRKNMNLDNSVNLITYLQSL